MTRQEFIDLLKFKKYAHKVTGREVIVTHHGSVVLSSLTTLPEGIKFENHGSVDLSSLTGQHAYMGKPRNFELVDGYSMITGSPKSHGGYTVKAARYMKGGTFSKMPKCYVAYGEGQTAHGDTIKSAIDDLQYKIADNADKLTLAREVHKTQVVTLAQFRGLTGACREGINQHLSGHGIDLSSIDSMSLPDAIKAMSGTSYGESFQRHMDASQ